MYEDVNKEILKKKMDEIIKGRDYKIFSLDEISNVELEELAELAVKMEMAKARKNDVSILDCDRKIIRIISGMSIRAINELDMEELNRLAELITGHIDDAVRRNEIFKYF